MMPRFEIVQTDADQPWHARSIAGNGEPVLWSEQLAERRAALEALRITAQLFSVTPAYFDVQDGVFYLNAGGMRVEVRDVDERAPKVEPDPRQWAVRAENGDTTYTSEDTARAVVGGYSGYTLGISESPIVAALTRATPDDEWVELT